MNFEKSKKVLVWLFYMAFSVLFSWVTINIIFNNPYHKTAYLLPATVLYVIGLITIYKILDRFEDFLKTRYNIILLAFCVIMLTIQIITGNVLRFEPAFDMAAIYDGAVEWVNTGTFKNYYDYYGWFPNNLGAMLYLFCFFKMASFVGITDYFMVGVVINSVMSVCTMAIVSLTCRRLKSEKHGLFALCIFALSLPFYIIGAVFYTDALSMLFPVLFYYLYLKAKDETNRKKRIIAYFMMGLAGAIGMQIKPTVLIGIIAVMIDMLINCDFKRFICTTACSAVVILIITLTVNGIMYTNHLDRETAKIKNTPYLHWIMMGHHGTGGYNSKDYEFTRSFKDPKARDKALSGEISNTVKELKYNGIFDLYSKKAAANFGDGTYGLSDFLDDNPYNKDTKLHKYVLYQGEKYKTYTHYCTALQIALFCIIVFGAYSVFVGKKKTGKTEIGPFASMLGIMLFLLVWETNRRYFSNFIPMIFICSVLSVDCFVDLIREKTEGIKQIFHT